MDNTFAHTWNLCDLPAQHIGSLQFNESPQRFEIQTVLAESRRLSLQLDGVGAPDKRTEIFNDYMTVKFHLDEFDKNHTPNARRSLRNTYLRYLRGWGVDSNSIEAAVLKDWVESRIGLRPTFHRGRMDGKDHESLLNFATDRMNGMARSNAIHAQLDLVYTFCQYELARRYPGERWFVLYRGTHGPSDYHTLQMISPRERIVCLNNLSSFTPDSERAFEFGSTVWEVRVPLVKIFFYSQLFPAGILKGEDEFLVIGGEYKVKTVL